MLRGVSDEAAFKAGLNNQVTANGLLKLLRMIAEGRAWSPEICAQMLEIMLDQRFKSGIPAGLPGDVHVAHKTGNISTVHHDAGIIYMGNRNPYFLVILTQFPAEAKRSGAVAEVSKDLFETLGRLPRPSEIVLDDRARRRRARRTVRPPGLRAAQLSRASAGRSTSSNTSPARPAGSDGRGPGGASPPR